MKTAKTLKTNHIKSRDFAAAFSLLALVVIFSSIFLTSSAATDNTEPNANRPTTTAVTQEEEYVDGGEIEGKNGETLTWTYTKSKLQSKGTLTISGEGQMKDYGRTDFLTAAPWNIYSREVEKIVIGEGITYIGKNSFSNMFATSVQLGANVEGIGQEAFYPGNTFSELTIPSKCNSIGYWAFCNNGIENLIIEEGVTSFNLAGFRANKFSQLNLPSTLTSFSDDTWTKDFLAEVNVAEGNTVFYSEDGVLFKYLSDGTGQLVKYPAKKSDPEYTIPSNVSSIGYAAFCGMQYTKKVTIPSTVTSTINAGNVFSSASGLEELIVEEGVVISSSRFVDSCTNLRKFSLPENSVSGTYFYFAGGAHSLEELYIPKTVTGIVDFSLSSNVNGLQRLYYDASNAINFQQQTDKVQKYELTIGKNVDILNNTTSSFGNNANGFQTVLKNAGTVKFVGPNQITIKENVFDDMPTPLNTFVGTIWVDEQGVVYKYDSETSTASVAYVPYDIESAVIPATITPETGVTCTVTSVDTYAFKLAEKLTTVSFEAPEKITSISTYAFADCTTLASVNGKTTVESVTASFTNDGVSMGYRPFKNTALTYESGEPSGGNFDELMDGQKTLTIQDMTISVIEDDITKWETNGYETLTGNSVQVNISRSNTDATDDIYRIYFELSELDGAISGLNVGETFTVNGNTYTCYATQAPNIYYIDVHFAAGNTGGVTLNAYYPSPSSAGGGLKVWGMVLSADEAAEKENEIIEYTYTDETKTTSNTVQAFWATKADELTLTKDCVRNNNQTSINLVGDGEGNIVPERDISYTITFNRSEEEVSSLGKDYVKTVDFRDYMTLPEGINWNQSVVDDIKAGNIRTTSGAIYAGDTLIATTNGSYKCGVEWDDEKAAPVFYWSRYNNSTTAEISVSMTFTLNKNALEVDNSLSNASETTYTVTNNVESTAHYTYSDDKTASASADRDFVMTEGNINIQKTSSGNKYFGEDVTFTLRVYNSGAKTYQDDGEYTLRDEMPQLACITPSNMEKMFNDTYGQNLTITVSNAKFGSKIPVTAENGATAYITGANSSSVASETAELTISKNADGKLQLKKGNDEPIIVETSLESTLELMGYYIDLNTTFRVVWNLNDDDGTVGILGGENRYYYIYATYKNTFELLSEDNENSYPNETIRNTNRSYIYKDSSALKSASTNFTGTREAYITKGASINGETLTNDTDIKLEDIVDYNLEFDHYGTGVYKNLPMVDDLSGNQSLLVLASENPQFAGQELRTTTKDGQEYYILSKPGVYEDVKIGVDGNGNLMIADTVTVTATGSGLSTQIKWYFSELPAYEYYITVRYSAIVDKDLIQSAAYSVGNTVWMNDRSGDRIYATILGSGSTLNSNKEIVTKNENGEYIADDDDYSVVKEGDEVYYRLTLSNPNDYDISIGGSNLIDALPNTLDLFSWEKGTNVELWADESAADMASGIDDWYISEEYLGLKNPGSYYINWPSETSVTVPGGKTFTMYVKLTFPNDTEENNELWTQYCDDMKGERIDNTFYIYNMPSTVYHSLQGKGKVLLQKGVYGTGWRRSDNIQSNYYEISNSRAYYNNTDSRRCQIVYYTVLYNDSSNRLYINDLHDELPKGFSFTSLTWGANYPVYKESTITYDGNSLIQTNSSSISYRNATITCVADGQNLTFSVSAGSGNNAIRYDEVRGKYYLEKGEALVFGYMCKIGEVGTTDDSATNTIRMEYDDYLDAGIDIISTDELSIYGKLTNAYTDTNDGNRGLESKDDTEYLTSSVTVVKGDIIPGVSKYTDSYTNENGDIFTYTNGAGPYDTINYRVRFHNYGEQSIYDYTFTDELPAPYTFTGSISLDIYDSQGELVARPYDNSHNVFTFGKRDGDRISITTSAGSTYTLTVNGDPVKVQFYVTNIGYEYIGVSISRNENGQEILTIDFKDGVFAIPENGGYMDISLSAENASRNYKNTVYTNQAYLTPNAQEYDSAGQGSLVRDESGNVVGIANTSPVNINSGYSTSSVKSVKEIGSDNFTDSNAETRNIILSDKASKFEYTLSVTNSTNFSMNKLVFIDSLPQVNDHSPFDENVSRDSEFRVSLDDNPDFKVTVEITNDDGTTTTQALSEDDYTVEYSTSQKFTQSDWKGESTQQWSNNPDGARSIRIIITDNTGEKIPNGSTVKVTFNAKSDDESAKSGQTAWNSFGYHYTLSGVDVELEALPLSVGVKIPDVPALQKKLVDVTGEPYKAAEDTTFKFDISCDGSVVKTYELTVEAGKSESEKIKLEDFDWENGKSYTITESNENADYEQKAWNNNTSLTSYTFTYDPSKSIDVICTNTYLKWSVTIDKYDSDNSSIKLQGAEFALYSSDVRDKISDYSGDIEQEIDYNGTTWYLADTGATDSNGSLTFKEIRGDKCLVKETKAPGGYLIRDMVYTKLSTDESKTIAVPNTAIILPETGLKGMFMGMLTGLVLVIVSLTTFAIYTKKKGL